MSQNIQVMIAFVLAGIATLRDTSKSFGVHSRYSKLSAAFAGEFGVPLYTVQFDSKGKYSGITGPLAAMVESGAIAIRPVKGGYMLYDGAEHKAAQSAAAGKRREADTAAAQILAQRIKSAIPAGKAVAAGKR
jgi:hypothetical protein